MAVSRLPLHTTPECEGTHSHARPTCHH
jgi:hypothetical protein